MKKTASVKRRSDHDRRQSQIPFYKLFLFKGKRRALRRTEDCNRVTVFDQYHPSLMITVLIVLALSLLDAALTLMLLDRGAVELNPVMRYFLTFGPGNFIMAKYVLTALALVVMVVLNTISSTRYPIVSFVIPFCGVAFGSVVIWELYLLAQ